jgi:hypothetical protein
MLSILERLMATATKSEPAVVFLLQRLRTMGFHIKTTIALSSQYPAYCSLVYAS